MKNYKSKTNLFFNLIKKNIMFQNINNILKNMKKIGDFGISKKKIIDNFKKFYEKNFRINYLIFILSIIFFYYLIYLSFPGILHNKNDQNYFTDLLNKKYGLEFALTPEISYSILPKPHFQVNDVIIFNKKDDFQKEIAEIKKVKIYLYQNNFFKKRNLKIKSLEFFESNFFINKFDLPFIKKFFKSGFKEKPLIIKRANLFYQDADDETISFLKLKKVNIKHKDEINQDLLTSEGDIYNIPFNVSWKQDLEEQITNIKLKKIKLQILNTNNIIDGDEQSKLQVYLNRSRFLINYGLKDKIINFISTNSFIGNDKLLFDGKIFLDPFNFEIESSLDSLKLKKIVKNILFFKEFISSDFILNENFNGKINLDILKLEKHPLFDNLNINANFVGQNIDFSSSIFHNEKIANLIIKKGLLYEEQNNLIFRGDLDFIVKDIKKFNNKFVVPKKNRIDLKKINFEVMINLTNPDFKILKIINDNYKDKEFSEVDELIYEFNSGGIKISNWIEFKIFANKIISSYSG